MNYAFIECRTDNERYIISSLISEFTNKPDKKWTALTINDEKKKEIVYWDNTYFLNKLHTCLHDYIYNNITRRQFIKKLEFEEEDSSTVEQIISSKKEARELFRLFQRAEELKMI